ncbi:MAG: germination protein YpeB, partial [Clostridia bacterium]
MKGKIVAIVLLSVGCVAAGIIAGGQARRAQQLERRLAAVHQQSFYHVVEGMDDVALQLSKLMVSAGPHQGVTLLTQISSQAGQVQENLAQIPLRHAAMSDSVKFVNQLTDYTRYLAGGMVDGRPLSETDQRQLEAMLQQCAQLGEQLHTLAQGSNPNALL